MAVKKEKDVKFNSNQSSSAATHYGGVDQSWLSKIKGTVNWIKIPQVDIAKIAGDIKNLLARFAAGNFVKEVATAIVGNLKELLGGGVQALKTQINSILQVGGKIVGTIATTAEGQGLAIFGLLSAALIGGGVLFGAGPEVITGMLRFSQVVYAFNFNETDEQIEAQIEGSISGLYAVAGETFGSDWQVSLVEAFFAFQKSK